MLSHAIRPLLVGSLLIGLVVLSHAQDDPSPGKRLALLVGVRQYKSEDLGSLKYTENDINQLGEVLEAAGYRVVRMTQKSADINLHPTAEDIRREIGLLLDPARRGPRDTVLIAFSGHGVQLKEGKEHYFCPQDARLDDLRTLVSLTEVYRQMEKCKAGTRLLFVDACRNDPESGSKGAKFAVKPRPQDNPPPGGVGALFSCAPGQLSYESEKIEHGVFFHYVIEGLKGKAANTRGDVTLESLAAYVKSEVADGVRELVNRRIEQTPHLVGDLRGTVPLLSVPGRPGTEARATKLFVYVGTYTSPSGSKGIHVCDLDLSTGKLAVRPGATEMASPSFLAVHPSRQFLYAVSEAADVGGKGGSVQAYRVHSDGKLEYLNRQPSGGAGPCHLTVDREGKAVLVANYGEGSVASLPLMWNGLLEGAISEFRHSGSSVNRTRQDRPHAHSINLDPGNRYALAADLGTDQILVYRFDASQGRLLPNDPPFASVPPGSGPRHLAFHPNGRFVYVVNELTSTITAFSFDGAKGALAAIETVPTVPEKLSSNHPAEVAVHPSGKYLYASNRGHDSLAIFSIDQGTGKLQSLGHEPTQGKAPRHFAIEPAGKYLLAANQDSNSIVVFRIKEDGRLTPSGVSVEIPKPVCIRFVPAK
jgi:6-phosphogluconolactonase